MKGPGSIGIRIILVLSSLIAFSISNYAQSSEKSEYGDIKQSLLFFGYSQNPFSKEKKTLNSYSELYDLHLGAFCKLENKMNSNTKMALRFRLGTLEYVDKIEQKIPAYKLTESENRNYIRSKK